MNDILAKLGAFSAAKDSRLACAAAVILSELAPRQGALVKDLVAGLNHDDPVRRPFIIEALGRIGTPEAAAALAPLIKGGGPNSEHALRAIAHAASSAIKPLLQLLGAVPAALLERVAECIARTGDAAALAGLLAHLRNADVDTCRAVRNGLRIAMTSFDEKSKGNLHKQLEKCFADSVLARHHPSLIALMKIGGDLGEISLLRCIQERTDSKYPMPVRRAALQSIAMLRLSGEQRAKLAPRILPLLLDPDIANLAEPALEAIRQARLGGEHHAQIHKLLNSQSSRIREFAMQALAQQGSTRTLSELIGCLDSPDRSLREEALGALSRAGAAAGPLAERLLKLESGESAAELARALSPQAAHIPRRLQVELAAHYVALAGGAKGKTDGSRAQPDELRRAIQSVFRAANSSELAEAVLARAAKLRQGDDAHQAYNLLKGIAGIAGWSGAHRIEMALAGISAGPKELSRAARQADTNLQALQEVLYSGRMTAKDLAKLLLRDKSLSRKALYYAGFHFVERMNNEREFGRMLLEHLAVQNRSDEGRQAKEKLVIEGLADAKSGKAGILEERAKVLMAAEDMAASSSVEKEVRPTQAAKSAKAAKPAKAAKTVKAAKPVPAAKSGRAAKRRR